MTPRAAPRSATLTVRHVDGPRRRRSATATSPAECRVRSTRSWTRVRLTGLCLGRQGAYSATDQAECQVNQQMRDASSQDVADQEGRDVRSMAVAAGELA